MTRSLEGDFVTLTGMSFITILKRRRDASFDGFLAKTRDDKNARKYFGGEIATAVPVVEGKMMN